MSTVAEKAAALPDPDQVANPQQIVVIWDGQCNFCRQQVLRLHGLDWTERLVFLSLHDPRVAQRYPELTFEQLMEQLWVITPAGERHGGADSMRYLSRAMPTLWPIAPLMHLPFTMPLWRAIYRWVASRRYRLAGKNCDGGTCHLHK